jgi:hypothetical protein
MQKAAEAAHLREQAARCRRLADAIVNPEASAALRKMAADYDQEALKAEGSSDEMPPPNELE